MDRTTITISDKSCRVYASPDPAFLLVQPTDDHELGLMDQEAAAIQEAADAPFTLAAFRVEDWNQELSPWDAPAVFGKENFGHGAADTLSFIENELLTELAEKLDIRENIPVILGGYSLAGLFSLWSGFESSSFTAIAAASPSAWFPGLVDFAASHKPQAHCIYLSLGDKESRARNPRMATVGDCIEKLADRFAEDPEVLSTLEWNPGNHFRNSDLRTAKAFAWCMNQLKK
ncbi:MAG: alpha/beta hydrolase [Eubacterium sp.]